MAENVVGAQDGAPASGYTTYTEFFMVSEELSGVEVPKTDPRNPLTRQKKKDKDRDKNNRVLQFVKLPHH